MGAKRLSQIVASGLETRPGRGEHGSRSIRNVNSEIICKGWRPGDAIPVRAALASGIHLLLANRQASTRKCDSDSVGSNELLSKQFSSDPTRGARIEAEVLLMHCLGIDRAQLYCRLDCHLSSETTSAYQRLVERRLGGEPVSYIIGHREFYGLDFFVDRRVLIPRPETERIVETVLRRFGAASGRGVDIVDVGTGSGAIAVSLAVNLPEARITATDRSFEALEVAQENVDRHSVRNRVHLVQGDLLEPIAGAIDVVVANLPYIPRDRLSALPRDVREFEPLGALDGGADGLDLCRRLIVQARRRLAVPGVILLEMDPEQVEPIQQLAHRQFPGSRVTVLKDYSGFDRVVVVDARVVQTA